MGLGTVVSRCDKTCSFVVQIEAWPRRLGRPGTQNLWVSFGLPLNNMFLRCWLMGWFWGYLPDSFQASFFSGNHQTPRGNNRFLKRTMVEKNGGSTPRLVASLRTWMFPLGKIILGLGRGSFFFPGGLRGGGVVSFGGNERVARALIFVWNSRGVGRFCWMGCWELFGLLGTFKRMPRNQVS